MSDDEVGAALRSEAPLVVVEAPAGCGKTHQGADYAKDLTAADLGGRPLILTHTHAACSVFAERTRNAGPRVTIRTFDSLIGQIAAAYHVGLDLPADPATWIRQRQLERGDGYAEIAVKVANLLKTHPMIAASLARRHTTVICDEHQDSSSDHHALMMALLHQGARVRVLADPMQKIFKEKVADGSNPACDWNALTSLADAHKCLKHPHRWAGRHACGALGQWTLAARETLKAGNPLDLRNGLPPSVQVVFAENQAQRHLDFRLARQQRKPIDTFVRQGRSLLVLTHHNNTARAFRSFFGRSLPLWEGYTRSALETLVVQTSTAAGNAGRIAVAIVTFLGSIGIGFSPSAFGNRFVLEVQAGCTKHRSGMPATLQKLARSLLVQPDHRGVAAVLSHLATLCQEDQRFSQVKIDQKKEFWDAVRIGDFDDVNDGLAQLTQRRAYARPQPPDRAISTIHKAKGLECDSVVIMPCDAHTLPDTQVARCLLYVALSRPRSRLMLVVSRKNPSPLLHI